MQSKTLEPYQTTAAKTGAVDGLQIAFTSILLSLFIQQQTMLHNTQHAKPLALLKPMIKYFTALLVTVALTLPLTLALETIDYRL